MNDENMSGLVACALRKVFDDKVLYSVSDSSGNQVKEEKKNGDEFKYKMAREFAVKGAVQKFATEVYGRFIEAVTGRQVTYPD